MVWCRTRGATNGKDKFERQSPPESELILPVAAAVILGDRKSVV